MKKGLKKTLLLICFIHLASCDLGKEKIMKERPVIESEEVQQKQEELRSNSPSQSRSDGMGVDLPKGEEEMTDEELKEQRMEIPETAPDFQRNDDQDYPEMDMNDEEIDVEEEY